MQLCTFVALKDYRCRALYLQIIPGCSHYSVLFNQYIFNFQQYLQSEAGKFASFDYNYVETSNEDALSSVSTLIFRICSDLLHPTLNSPDPGLSCVPVSAINESLQNRW